MSITDPISDALTMVRNASSRRKEKVDVPVSKHIVTIVEVLKKERFIKDARLLEDENPKHLRIYLRYTSSQEPVIRDIKRISKPGLRKYVDVQHLPRVLNGLGIAIISTSEGVVTDRQARELGLGGEVICYVW